MDNPVLENNPVPNLAQALKEEIARLARKEIRKEVVPAKKQQSQHRSDIAALKREIADLRRQVSFLEKQEKKRIEKGPMVVPAAAASNAAAADTSDGRSGPRFQARGLRSHREKLGLSAADYGALVGVTGQTIYAWEQEKSKPRKAQIVKLAEVRGLGKREALKRIKLTE